MASDAEILEPEVIPPGASGPKAAEAVDPGGVNPILAGLIVDVLNLFLFGLVGFAAGGAVGFWAARSHRFPVSLAALVGLGCGWYCGIPLPSRLPLATLVGLVIVLWRKWAK